MHTILGANGQIAQELARTLHRGGTTDLRLVSRTPRAVNATDELVSADLLDVEQTREAVRGSDVVSFVAGLPADTALWEARFPTMLRNALDAARRAGAGFAYFDNTYMYPQTDAVQTEETPFAPVGRKGHIRAEMAELVLAEMARGDIPVLIARAPEFYGPGRTQSFTNTLIIDRLRSGKKPVVPVRDDTIRSLIWTPDASRALALLATTPDAFGETWHLPIDQERLTYREFVGLASTVFGGTGAYSVVPAWVLSAAGIFSAQAKEMRELLPRYQHDNTFDATKFARRFPGFAVTSYRDGLTAIRAEGAARAA